MKKYESLKIEYPEYISLDQLYRICKISKRAALYLISNEIIPAIDTGKKTWRYKIAVDDVITYLRRREQVGSMIPVGAVSSRGKVGEEKILSCRKSFSQVVMQGQEWEVAEYFQYIYEDCPDVLTTDDIADMTGLSRSTVLHLVQNRDIRSIADNRRYFIPKKYLMEFIVTPRFIETKTNSELFKKILGGFEIWRTAKSSL